MDVAARPSYYVPQFHRVSRFGDRLHDTPLSRDKERMNKFHLRVLSFRAAMVLLSLYKPHKPVAKLERRAKRISKTASFHDLSDYSVHDMRKSPFLSFLEKLQLSMSSYYHPASRRVRILDPDPEEVFHELTHKLGVSNNHKVTATAIDTYIQYPRLRRTQMLGSLPWADLQVCTDKSEIEHAFRGPFRRFSLFEHTQVTKRPALSDLGEQLGRYAHFFEMRAEKPSAGAFLIRKVSLGTPFAVAEREILDGRHDVDIARWRRINKHHIDAITNEYEVERE